MKKTLLISTAVLLNFTFMFLLVACKKANQDPISHFTITPETGSTNTTFQFDASGSTDNEDPTHMLEVRWDFEGDGLWNTEWSTVKTTNQKYETFSSHAPTLEVRDSDGETHTLTLPLLVVNDYISKFTDPRDGIVYKTVTIGTQTWFAENLNYDTTVALFYNDNTSLGVIYGRLYDWETSRFVCPLGWHLPDVNEWDALRDYLGSNASEKAREAGYDHWAWLEGVDEANNESRFTALPGGQLLVAPPYPPIYEGLTSKAEFWTSSPSSTTGKSWSYGIGRTYPLGGYFNGMPDIKEFGKSIRCIKD